MRKGKKQGIRNNNKDLADQDYFNKLSPEEQQWLNAFNQANYNANFKPLEAILGSKIEGEMRDDMNRQNYSARVEAMAGLSDAGELNTFEGEVRFGEDVLIDLIDIKK